MSSAVKLAVAIWEASAKAVLRVIVSAPSRAGGVGGAGPGRPRTGTARRSRVDGRRVLCRCGEIFLRRPGRARARSSWQGARAAAAESASRTHHEVNHRLFPGPLLSGHGAARSVAGREGFEPSLARASRTPTARADGEGQAITRGIGNDEGRFTELRFGAACAAVLLAWGMSLAASTRRRRHLRQGRLAAGLRRVCRHRRRTVRDRRQACELAVAGPDRLPARRRLPGRREGEQGWRHRRADDDHQLSG